VNLKDNQKNIEGTNCIACSVDTCTLDCPRNSQGKPNLVPGVLISVSISEIVPLNREQIARA
jgi:hypothetical protein